MHERTTSHPNSAKGQKVYPSAEAPDSQGMGAIWKRFEVAEKYQIHPQTLYRWRKALEQGAQAFLSGKKTRVDPRIKKLEKENQRLKEALALQTQELMLLKKEMNLL